MWYHALNRGNRREAVFHKDEVGDYAAFVEAMVDARKDKGGHSALLTRKTKGDIALY